LQTGDTIQRKPLRLLIRYRTTIANGKEQEPQKKHSVLIFNDSKS